MFNPYYRKFIPLVFILLAGLAGCSSAGVRSQDAAPESITMINPVGPLVLPVAGLTSGAVESAVPISVQYWKTGDEAIGLLSNGSTQFAVLPITTRVNMNAAAGCARMESVLFGCR